MNEIMRREELSMPQVVTLFFLHRRQSASISDIRSHLNLSLAATSQLTDRLVMAGLVSRTEDALDRRQKQVTPTPKGTALVGELEQARLSRLVHRLGEMSGAELESTIATFTNILRYLDETEIRHEASAAGSC